MQEPAVSLPSNRITKPLRLFTKHVLCSIEWNNPLNLCVCTLVIKWICAFIECKALMQTLCKTLLSVFHKEIQMNCCFIGGVLICVVYVGSILGPDGGFSGGIDTDGSRICIPSSSLRCVRSCTCCSEEGTLPALRHHSLRSYCFCGCSD